MRRTNHEPGRNTARGPRARGLLRLATLAAVVALAGAAAAQTADPGTGGTAAAPAGTGVANADTPPAREAAPGAPARGPRATLSVRLLQVRGEPGDRSQQAARIRNRTVNPFDPESLRRFFEE